MRFDPRHVTRSLAIGKSILIGRHSNGSDVILNPTVLFLINVLQTLLVENSSKTARKIKSSENCIASGGTK